MFNWLRGLFRKPDPQGEAECKLKPIEREAVYVLLITQPVAQSFWAVAVDSAETAVQTQSILNAVYRDLSITITKQFLRESGDKAILNGAKLR